MTAGESLSGLRCWLSNLSAAWAISLFRLPAFLRVPSATSAKMSRGLCLSLCLHDHALMPSNRTHAAAAHNCRGGQLSHSAVHADLGGHTAQPAALESLTCRS